MQIKKRKQKERPVPKNGTRPEKKGQLRKVNRLAVKEGRRRRASSLAYGLFSPSSQCRLLMRPAASTRTRPGC